MNFNKNHITMLSLIGGIVLLIGLFTIVLLVQKQQEIRSGATSPDVYNAFNVTDSTGNPLQYKDESGVRAYETNSLDVTIKINDPQKLIDEGQQ